MVQDLVHNLCESLVVNIDGVAGVGKKTTPTPITYLTQWKIAGNSEVHTLPYPDGVVLPTGYKRCEYLVFDGDSYINTGIKTSNDIGYNFACTNTNSSARVLIGARKDITLDGFGLGYSYVGYGGETVIKGIQYSTSKVNVLLDATQCKVGDDNYDISDIRATATTFFDIYVGTWNQNDSPDWRMWIGNIYDTIIYNTQGELWHGIPCLDANDVPCFYDIVSQTAFYNQGSGSFTYKLYPQPTEIWSCGEYNATDGKYHILVQPLGGSIADIALDEPLRKVNDVADTIEFANNVATVTRNIKSIDLGSVVWDTRSTSSTGLNRYSTQSTLSDYVVSENLLLGICSHYTIITEAETYRNIKGIAISITSSNLGKLFIYDDEVNTLTNAEFMQYVTGVELLYELATATTELVDAPQIAEAESYTCEISQGGKAVEWTEFVANPT